MRKNSAFILRTLDLAKRGGAMVAPNPMVGAVVEHDGKIIGEGYHKVFGGPHAEVEAIRSVKDHSLLSGSTLYVSLEPCNFQGKTPACSQLILKHKIPKVVVGCLDPNPKVAGKSVEILGKSGVEVEVAEDQRPFLHLIRTFSVNQIHHRPYIILKWAQSKDGFIAKVDPSGIPFGTPISGARVNKEVHRLRSEIQSILVGKNTVRVDNPSLTTRLYPGPSPIRIVFDMELDLPMDKKIFRGKGRSIVINRKKEKVIGDVRWYVPDDPDDLPGILRALFATFNIGSILVEGGRETLGNFIRADLFDEIIRITGPDILGGGIHAPELPDRIEFSEIKVIGEDTWESALKH